MRTESHHIVAWDRLHHGLFFYFKDGTQGFFPDELLHRMLGLPDVLHKDPYPELAEMDDAAAN